MPAVAVGGEGGDPALADLAARLAALTPEQWADVLAGLPTAVGADVLAVVRRAVEGKP